MLYAQYLMELKRTGRQYPVYVNNANDNGRVFIAFKIKESLDKGLNHR